MWGQDLKAVSLTLLGRIIPMRVGTRGYQSALIKEEKDHPHACGDKTKMAILCLYLRRSSPCVWGQDCRYQVCRLLNRIIPMRVGTRTAIVQLISSLGDHPHACGDKQRRMPQKSILTGSSPCVWGQERQRMRIHARMRIIPMRVGTSYL